MTRRMCWLAMMMLVVGACQSASGIMIDKGADGTRFSMAVGEILDIALQANPSTGFTWEVTSLDEMILRPLGEPTFDPESTLAGAPGTMHLMFETLTAGTTTLELAYHKPSESVAPAATFAVTVTVG